MENAATRAGSRYPSLTQTTKTPAISQDPAMTNSLFNWYRASPQPNTQPVQGIRTPAHLSGSHGGQFPRHRSGQTINPQENRPVPIATKQFLSQPVPKHAAVDRSLSACHYSPSSDRGYFHRHHNINSQNPQHVQELSCLLHKLELLKSYSTFYDRYQSGLHEIHCGLVPILKEIAGNTSFVSEASSIFHNQTAGEGYSQNDFYVKIKGFQNISNLLGFTSRDLLCIEANDPNYPAVEWCKYGSINKSQWVVIDLARFTEPPATMVNKYGKDQSTPKIQFTPDTIDTLPPMAAGSTPVNATDDA